MKQVFKPKFNPSECTLNPPNVDVISQALNLINYILNDFDRHVTVEVVGPEEYNVMILNSRGDNLNWLGPMNKTAVSYTLAGMMEIVKALRYE